ncbi:protein Mpv17-like [Diabrotica virgifera virgifera]|uniref:Mitochondrial inner membrane protein Mpv17 n=1 Tax=Diabrotica virgifera virgifera TaxID=50390 RepID=A0A6P7FTY8_DIAVI|nr:protein Mpv17-like [Diabrotica virgifera virgifera]
MNIIKSCMKYYTGLLKTNFVLVQSVQSGLLCGSGDVIAQVVAERKNIDLHRTGCFLVLGSCFIGPVITVWYRFLSRKLGDKGKFVALKKVAADQLLFVPPFQIALISTINIIQGRNLEFTKEQLRLKYTDILIANYKLWPAVQIVNFYFVPLNYQVLLVQSVALFWNAYVSWKTQYGIVKND